MRRRGHRCAWVWGGLLDSWAALLLSAAPGGGLDSSFDPGGGHNAGLNGDVFAIAVQPDGRLLIGGIFTAVDRTSRNGVARLNGDGSLDPGFDPGSGADGLVETLCLQTDGKVLIGGRFENFDGQPQPYLARLNANGSRDTGFVSAPDDWVFASAAQADGRVLIGGAFTSVAGLPRIRIARLNRDGTVDAGFNVSPGPDRDVFALAIQPDGRILVGGDFDSIGGSPRGRIARLHPDGSVDLSFDPGTGVDRVVTSLRLQPDGRVLMGGGFTNVSGVTHYYLARLDPSGSLDSTFNAKIDLWFGGLYVVVAQPDGRVLAGGDFRSVAEVPRNCVARFNHDGPLDDTFDPGLGPGDSEGFGPIIRAMAIQADGRIVVGGMFDYFDGVRIDNIARLMGDQGGTIEFAAPTVQTSEAVGMAEIALQRQGTLAGPVSVDVAIVGGTATPGSDFVLSDRGVVFEAGETRKSLRLSVTRDFLAEGTEDVILALGNPIGGLILGHPATAAVTIADAGSPAASRFVSVTRLDNDQIRLVLDAPENQAYVLETSAELSTWLPVRTNTPVAGQCVFEYGPLGIARQGFYRAYGQ